MTDDTTPCVRVYMEDMGGNVWDMTGMEFSDRMNRIMGSSGELVLALSHLEDEMRTIGMDLDVSYADEALMRLDRELHQYADEHYLDLHGRNVHRPSAGPATDSQRSGL